VLIITVLQSFVISVLQSLLIHAFSSLTVLIRGQPLLDPPTEALLSTPTSSMLDAYAHQQWEVSVWKGMLCCAWSWENRRSKAASVKILIAVRKLNEFT
jgi:hypothetical protein